MSTLPAFVPSLEAHPEKGVIVVEYYWEDQPVRPKLRHKDGKRTSMVYFKPLRAADKCWCGKGKKFARCHRRADDWTYVTLDPDQGAFSPVTLFLHRYPQADFQELFPVLASLPDLRGGREQAPHSAWCVLADPPLSNDIGHLTIGTIAASPQGLQVDTNSLPRLEHLAARLSALFGDSLGPAVTFSHAPNVHIPAAP